MSCEHVGGIVVSVFRLPAHGLFLSMVIRLKGSERVFCLLYFRKVVIFRLFFVFLLRVAGLSLLSAVKSHGLIYRKDNWAFRDIVAHEQVLYSEQRRDKRLQLLLSYEY